MHLPQRRMSHILKIEKFEGRIRVYFLKTWEAERVIYRKSGAFGEQDMRCKHSEEGYQGDRNMVLSDFEEGREGRRDRGRERKILASVSYMRHGEREDLKEFSEHL